jgi:hypothetical protein
MVLRGEQFRRYRPSRCALRTRQAPSFNRTGLMHGRLGMRVNGGSRIPSKHRIPWTSEIAAGHTKDSRAMAREGVLYVVGILGNRDRSLYLGGHAPGVHGHPLIQEHQE